MLAARWRLYILIVMLCVAAACVLLLKAVEKHGHPISRGRKILFTLGVLLTVDTVIVFTLSNFNLGVILPAMLGVPMIFVAVLNPRMGSGPLRAVRLILMCGYAAVVLALAVCGVLMITAGERPEKVDADAVIVLGAAVHGEKVTWVLENRLNTARDFLELHPGAVCVVSGGMGSGETVTEASAMKKYLVAQGVAPERIYLEEKATNTKENFAFSKELLDAELGEGKKLAFVTTDFHVYRAGRTAKAQGIDARGIAAPDVWYLHLNNLLRETVGICWYAVSGGF